MSSGGFGFDVSNSTSLAEQSPRSYGGNAGITVSGSGGTSPNMLLIGLAVALVAGYFLFVRK